METEEKEQEQQTNEQSSSRMADVAKDAGKDTAKATGKAATKFVAKMGKALIKLFLMLPLPVKAVIILAIIIAIAVFCAIAQNDYHQEGYDSTIQHTQEKAGTIGSGEDSGSSVAPGQNGYVFYQKDFADVPFGGDNVATAGCGITSMSMCVSDLLGKEVTPKSLASEFNINAYWVSGLGVSWDFFPACAEHFGLQCQELGTSPDSVVQALKEGKKVISSQTASNGSQFTQGGHIIYFYGVDSSNQIIIKDPNYSNSEMVSHSWDPATVCGWSANNWAIWK